MVLLAFWHVDWWSYGDDGVNNILVACCLLHVACCDLIVTYGNHQYYLYCISEWQRRLYCARTDGSLKLTVLYIREFKNYTFSRRLTRNEMMFMTLWWCVMTRERQIIFYRQATRRRIYQYIMAGTMRRVVVVVSVVQRLFLWRNEDDSSWHDSSVLLRLGGENRTDERSIEEWLAFPDHVLWCKTKGLQENKFTSSKKAQ